MLELFEKTSTYFLFFNNREWGQLYKSEASIETTLQSALPGVWIQAEQESSCAPKVPYRLWGPPCLLLNDSFPGKKRQGYEFYHPPQYSAEVKNEYSYTLPVCIFMASTGTTIISRVSCWWGKNYRQWRLVREIRGIGYSFVMRTLLATFCFLFRTHLIFRNICYCTNKWTYN